MVFQGACVRFQIKHCFRIPNCIPIRSHCNINCRAGVVKKSGLIEHREDKRACLRMPLVSGVIPFGSPATGHATPRSDADVPVIFDGRPHEQPHHRIPEVPSALSPLPCPIDPVVVTRADFERFQMEGFPILRAALEMGRDLL